MARGRPPVPQRDRFLKRIEVTEDGHWLATCPFFSIQGRPTLMKRAAWLIFVGDVPPGHHIRRIPACDFPMCCAPQHLYARLPLTDRIAAARAAATAFYRKHSRCRECGCHISMYRPRSRRPGEHARVNPSYMRGICVECTTRIDDDIINGTSRRIPWEALDQDRTETHTVTGPGWSLECTNSDDDEGLWILKD